MSSVVFEPWIGSRFERNNRFGLRVLVLGESHYGAESESHPAFTTEIVRKLGQKERHSFFTKVAKILLGVEKYIDNEKRVEVWEHVAFYNYIQCLAGPSARFYNRGDGGNWCEVVVKSRKSPKMKRVKRI